MSVIAACRNSRSTMGSRKCNRYRGEKGGLWRIMLYVFRSLGLTLRLGLVLAVVAGLSLGLLSAYRWMTIHPYFGLAAVEVTGNLHLSHSRVMALTGLNMGENCLSLDMREIESSILTDPWVKSVAVKRVLPNRLVIRVDEHEPAYWVQQGEQLFYAERDGRIIAEVTPERFVSLPILLLGEDGSFRQSVLATVRSWLDGRQLPFSLGEVGWVRFLSDGILEVYVQERGLRIFLGTDALEQNLGNLAPLWRDLEERSELSRARELRMYGDKAWVRLEPAT